MLCAFCMYWYCRGGRDWGCGESLAESVTRTLWHRLLCETSFCLEPSFCAAATLAAVTVLFCVTCIMIIISHCWSCSPCRLGFFIRCVEFVGVCAAYILRELLGLITLSRCIRVNLRIADAVRVRDCCTRCSLPTRCVADKKLACMSEDSSTYVSLFCHDCLYVEECTNFVEIYSCNSLLRSCRKPLRCTGGWMTKENDC